VGLMERVIRRRFLVPKNLLERFFKPFLPHRFIKEDEKYKIE